MNKIGNSLKILLTMKANQSDTQAKKGITVFHSKLKQKIKIISKLHIVFHTHIQI